MYNVVLSPIDPEKLISSISERVTASILKEIKKDLPQPTEQGDRFLTVQEAAEFLKLSPATIYGKVHRNELPYMKRGKKVYFSRRELMEYLKAGRVKSATEIAGEAEKLLSNK